MLPPLSRVSRTIKVHPTQCGDVINCNDLGIGVSGMDSSQYGDPNLTGGLKSRDIKCFVFPEACMLCSRDDCRIGGMGISTAHVLLTACAALPFLSLCLVPSSSMMPVVVRGQVGGSGTCVLVNCSIPALECMLDSQCRKASGSVGTSETN